MWQIYAGQYGTRHNIIIIKFIEENHTYYAAYNNPISKSLRV